MSFRAMRWTLFGGLALWACFIQSVSCVLMRKAPAQSLELLLVYTEPFVVCPRTLEADDCPVSVTIPLATQPTDPAGILPPILTTSSELVGGAYGVPLSHCRLDAVGFTIPTDPAFQVEGQAQSKSPAVTASVIPVSNGKATMYAVRVLTQPCQRSPWQVERVVVMQVVP